MTITDRIARTGYVIMYPAIESLAQGEQWFLCNDAGVIQTRGNGYNAGECRAMLERGELVEHVRLLTGVVIYKQQVQS